MATLSECSFHCMDLHPSVVAETYFTLHWIVLSNTSGARTARWVAAMMQRSRGGPVDFGGHHLSRGIIGTFEPAVARGWRWDNGFWFLEFRNVAFAPILSRWPSANVPSQARHVINVTKAKNEDEKEGGGRKWGTYVRHHKIDNAIVVFKMRFTDVDPQSQFIVN